MIQLVKIYSRLGAAAVTLIVAVLGVVTGLSLQALLIRCIVSFFVCFVCLQLLGMILGRIVLRRLLEDRGLRGH